MDFASVPSVHEHMIHDRLRTAFRATPFAAGLGSAATPFCASNRSLKAEAELLYQLFRSKEQTALENVSIGAHVMHTQTRPYHLGADRWPDGQAKECDQQCADEAYWTFSSLAESSARDVYQFGHMRARASLLVRAASQCAELPPDNTAGAHAHGFVLTGDRCELEHLFPTLQLNAVPRQPPFDIAWQSVKRDFFAGVPSTYKFHVPEHGVIPSSSLKRGRDHSHVNPFELYEDAKFLNL